MHLHPTVVNGLMCANNVESELLKLFGEKTLYVEYTDPGYVLFKKVNYKIAEYRLKHNEEPKVIWLQNHGVFVGANSTDEIESIYTEMLDILESEIKDSLHFDNLKVAANVVDILPALRMILSKEDVTDSIVDSIREAIKIDEPGNGIIFIQDVNQTYGIYE